MRSGICSTTQRISGSCLGHPTLFPASLHSLGDEGNSTSSLDSKFAILCEFLVTKFRSLSSLPRTEFPARARICCIMFRIDAFKLACGFGFPKGNGWVVTGPLGPTARALVVMSSTSHRNGRVRRFKCACLSTKAETIHGCQHQHL